MIRVHLFLTIAGNLAHSTLQLEYTLEGDATCRITVPPQRMEEFGALIAGSNLQEAIAALTGDAESRYWGLSETELAAKPDPSVEVQTHVMILESLLARFHVRSQITKMELEFRGF